MKNHAVPTMRDVAREAGVAIGTVSKVFNQQSVGEPYRRRVLEAAEKLGYSVNSYARGLRSGKSSTVALILPDLQDLFLTNLALQVCDALARRDCRMLLFLTHESEAEEQRCLRLARAHNVDGVIALCSSQFSENENLVYIDSSLSPTHPCVSSDNYGGGQLAAQTLRDLGCMHLLGLQLCSPGPGERQKRIQGFEFACRAMGMDHELCWNSENDEELIWSCLEGHLHNGTFDFDGVFCGSDELAYQVKSWLRENGVAVPEQVQIIGYGGLQPPGLSNIFCSTIRQPVREMAEKAVELVLGTGKTVPYSVCLSVSFLPGGTTKGRQEP